MSYPVDAPTVAIPVLVEVTPVGPMRHAVRPVHVGRDRVARWVLVGVLVAVGVLVGVGLAVMVADRAPGLLLAGGAR